MLPIAFRLTCALHVILLYIEIDTVACRKTVLYI